MTFNVARLRVREIAEALSVDSEEIIATCTLLNIPASSPLSSLTVQQCKKIIDYVQSEDNRQDID